MILLLVWQLMMETTDFSQTLFKKLWISWWWRPARPLAPAASSSSSMGWPGRHRRPHPWLDISKGHYKYSYRWILHASLPSYTHFSQQARSSCMRCLFMRHFRPGFFTASSLDMGHARCKWASSDYINKVKSHVCSNEFPAVGTWTDRHFSGLNSHQLDLILNYVCTHRITTALAVGVGSTCTKALSWVLQWRICVHVVPEDFSFQRGMAMPASNVRLEKWTGWHIGWPFLTLKFACNNPWWPHACMASLCSTVVFFFFFFFFFLPFSATKTPSSTACCMSHWSQT